jgi:anti-sigma B factor antagonist
MTHMPDARFPVEMTGGVPVVVTPGEIDITNAGQFREALLAAVERGTGIIVIDLGQTQFCDSAGLHALVAAHKRARADGGEVRLVIPGVNVLRIFAISGLDRVIPCHSDLHEALASSDPHQSSPVRCA